VLKLYKSELADVKSLDPKADLVGAIEGEVSDLETKRKELYPRAIETLGGGSTRLVSGGVPEQLP